MKLLLKNYQSRQPIASKIRYQICKAYYPNKVYVYAGSQSDIQEGKTDKYGYDIELISSSNITDDMYIVFCTKDIGKYSNHKAIITSNHFIDIPYNINQIFMNSDVSKDLSKLIEIIESNKDYFGSSIRIVEIPDGTDYIVQSTELGKDILYLKSDL